MSRSCVLALAMLGLLSGMGRSDDAPKAPTGPSPRLVVVADVKADDAVFTAYEVVTEAVPVQEERTVLVMGIEQKVKVTVYRTVSKTVAVKHDLTGADIQTAGGDRLKVEDALKRLKRGSPVVLSANGNKIDPVYLDAFKRDTLVIVPGAAAPFLGR